MQCSHAAPQLCRAFNLMPMFMQMTVDNSRTQCAHATPQLFQAFNLMPIFMQMTVDNSPTQCAHAAQQPTVLRTTVLSNIMYLYEQHLMTNNIPMSFQMMTNNPRPPRLCAAAQVTIWKVSANKKAPNSAQMMAADPCMPCLCAAQHISLSKLSMLIFKLVMARNPCTQGSHAKAQNIFVHLIHIILMSVQMMEVDPRTPRPRAAQRNGW